MPSLFSERGRGVRAETPSHGPCVQVHRRASRESANHMNVLVSTSIVKGHGGAARGDATGVRLGSPWAWKRQGCACAGGGMLLGRPLSMHAHASVPRQRRREGTHTSGDAQTASECMNTQHWQ